ncbi:MAG: RagB/SusD family nutrient uptake outer membrane protein, partial [Bacteroidaceae bacterium]|nr:RagB/SusD family nutrient uptake outer membrane protein [Bacteroidaceae bacterium]
IPESISGDELISAIIIQKNKEFAGEGVNWFDLKRTNSQTTRLGNWGQSVSSVIKSNDYRWTMPIPSSEYKYNDNVRQNDGWHINVE